MHLVDGGQRLEAAVWGGEKGGGTESHMVAFHTATPHISSTCLHVCLGIAFIFARQVTE